MVEEITVKLCFCYSVQQRSLLLSTSAIKVPQNVSFYSDVHDCVSMLFTCKTPDNDASFVMQSLLKFVPRPWLFFFVSRAT